MVWFWNLYHIKKIAMIVPLFFLFFFIILVICFVFRSCWQELHSWKFEFSISLRKSKDFRKHQTWPRGTWSFSPSQVHNLAVIPFCQPDEGGTSQVQFHKSFLSPYGENSFGAASDPGALIISQLWQTKLNRLQEPVTMILTIPVKALTQLCRLVQSTLFFIWS